MLKCRDIVTDGSDYLDGEMGFARRLKIRFHLLMCVHCRRYVQHLKTTLQFMHRHGKSPLPREEADALSENIQQKDRNQRDS